MAFRPLAKNTQRLLGPTAPRKRFVLSQEPSFNSSKAFDNYSEYHSFTNIEQNKGLKEYEKKVKGRFDLIVPALKKIASIQHESDFVSLSLIHISEPTRPY